MIIKATVHEGKQVPQWMMSGAMNNPGLGLFYMMLFQKKYYLTMIQVLAVCWVVVSLAFEQYAAFVSYPRNGIYKIMEMEAGMLPFLLLTWLLPAYFLKRYLQKL